MPRPLRPLLLLSAPALAAHLASGEVRIVVIPAECARRGGIAARTSVPPLVLRGPLAGHALLLARATVRARVHGEHPLAGVVVDGAERVVRTPRLVCGATAPASVEGCGPIRASALGAPPASAAGLDGRLPIGRIIVEGARKPRSSPVRPVVASGGAPAVVDVVATRVALRVLPPDRRVYACLAPATRRAGLVCGHPLPLVVVEGSPKLHVPLRPIAARARAPLLRRVRGAGVLIWPVHPLLW
mmetsp:Transcript_34267/g.91828  ORF Transcript_34267/g.91828 Transcript_34267/m.91828 type:complete len:243 (-) Transcript_34267:405-1133(-)